MDLIHADASGYPIQVLEYDIDFQVGTSNTFEMAIPYTDYVECIVGVGQGIELGHRIYLRDYDENSPGNEFGGIVTEIDIQTENNQVFYRGTTWRGLLDRNYVIPPTTSASDGYYHTLSGDVNTSFDDIISKFFATRSTTGEELYILNGDDLSGIGCESVQLPRFCTITEALWQILSDTERGDRFLFPKVRYKEIFPDGSNQIKGYLNVYGEPITLHSTHVTDGGDNGGDDAIIQKYEQITNVIIGLGSGELKNRTVIYAYMDREQTVDTPTYTKNIDNSPLKAADRGYVVSETLDYSGATEAELFQSASERLLELERHDTYELNPRDDLWRYAIGDMVGITDHRLGYDSAFQQVTEIILKRVNMELSEQYVFKEIL